jgi:hypothetical protein
MPGHAFRPFGGDSIAVVTTDDLRHEANCFADDVVVDFPSISRAVDRMRSAFLADERPSAVPTALRLSRHEAITGVTMPLEVPVRCLCRHCGGRGESWTESCLRCSGSGTELFRHHLQVTVPAGVCDGARFHFMLSPRHHPPTRIELQILVA